MLRCTIRILSHDLTHHSVIPYRNNHATSPDVATPQLTSLSILNYPATISPLPPRPPTSPPFRSTIPCTPFHIFLLYFRSTFVPSCAVTMRGDGTNHHGKLGLRRISCASQFTIPDGASTSPDPACNNTDTWSFQPNQASRTPDFSYPLISSTSCSSPSPSLSFSSTTLPSSQNTKLSHSSLSLHAMIMSRYRVQHTPSTAYTEYSIHRVQHTSSTAYSEYSIHRVQHTPSTAYTEYSIHRV